MRRIAVEEHFLTRDYIDYLRTRKVAPKREIFADENHRKVERTCYSDLCCLTTTNPEVGIRNSVDIGEGRLGEMDEAGVTMQVLSLSAPGVEAFEPADGIIWARKTNDELTAAIKKHPDRFAGLAALPMQEPGAAADELERAVKDLKLSGAKVNSHVRGEYLDNRKYWVVFEKAEKLGVPVYIHPREPAPGMVEPFLAYPRLWDAMWGYGAEVGLHAMRLICSGVFDEYPRLKIVIGHMGEALPFWIWRIDDMWRNTPMAKKLRKIPSEYLKDNFAISTSGMYSVPAFMCAYLTLGADRILFATDYTTRSKMVEGVQFMDAVPICDGDKEKVYHINAEKLFHL